MRPIVNGLEAEYGNQMAFEYRDANRPNGEAAMSAYNLRGHPSYLILAPDGELLWSFTGVLPEATLREQIEQQ